VRAVVASAVRRPAVRAAARRSATGWTALAAVEVGVAAVAVVRDLWVPTLVPLAVVLGHGLNNTQGLVAYYLVGPVQGLW